MTFHEKLERLTEDRKKTVVSRRAGLPDSAVSNYITKLQEPPITIAVRLARVLQVELEWLVDDEREWPPVWRRDEVAA
jgi:transcriptional regulator with XRE-family HTH domain